MADAPHDAADATAISVEVVHAMPEGYRSLRLRLAAGATVADALARAPEFAGVVHAERVAVHGQRVALGHALADGDRIELLRPLLADPKDVRRQRAAQARRRPR